MFGQHSKAETVLAIEISSTKKKIEAVNNNQHKQVKLKRYQHGQYLVHESVLFLKSEKNPDPLLVLKQVIKTELKIEKKKQLNC